MIFSLSSNKGTGALSKGEYWVMSVGCWILGDNDYLRFPFLSVSYYIGRLISSLYISEEPAKYLYQLVDFVLLSNP